MLRTAATLALVTGAPGFVTVAFAHGGSYRGPAGEVPPDSREPSDPPPPPEGGGPATPGGDAPGGPTTGGPDTGGPSTPGGGGSGPSTGGGPSSGPTGGGGGGGGPTTGGAGKPKGAAKGSGYDDWTFWWNYNKDEILQLKSAVRKMQKNPSTGSSAGAFGAKPKGTAIKSATDESIQKNIVPLLHQFLEDREISFHIQSAAELGLAKIGDESILETLKKMALNDAKPSYHREVQESAGLAYGLLQKDTEEVRSFLIEIIKDGTKDDSFLRPFSAISLGLLGDKNDRDSKSRTAILEILSKKEPKGDIKPSCLTALGLLQNDAAVGELLTMVQTGKTSQKGAEALSDNDIAFAVSALGKIGRPGTDKVGQETAVIDEMFKIVDPKSKVKHSTNARRSAAIALGQIGPGTDAKMQKKVLDVLKNLAEEAQDTQEKNFAIISIGRMGAVKGIDEKLRGEMISVLRKELTDGKGLTPPFAALSLGLIGRSFSEEGRPAPEEEIRAPIRKKFDEEKEAKARGAYAVASGLVRDPLAVESLKKVLMDAGMDKRVRGYCALGLGMIGAPEAVDAIKHTLKNDNDRDLRVQTAMAAGLLGDGSVIEDIVKILKDKDASNYELGSAALALGQIGDESAIDALVEIAKDEKKTYPDLTRSLATVALGQIGDRRDVPVLSRVATDINYRAHVAAITELLTIL
jgi:HEAT repeat protein